jgi:hypothetical protein
MGTDGCSQKSIIFMQVPRMVFINGLKSDMLVFLPSAWIITVTVATSTLERVSRQSKICRDQGTNNLNHDGRFSSKSPREVATLDNRIAICELPAMDTIGDEYGKLYVPPIFLLIILSSLSLITSSQFPESFIYPETLLESIHVHLYSFSCSCPWKILLWLNMCSCCRTTSPGFRHNKKKKNFAIFSSFDILCYHSIE